MNTGSIFSTEIYRNYFEKTLMIFFRLVSGRFFRSFFYQLMFIIFVSSVPMSWSSDYFSPCSTQIAKYLKTCTGIKGLIFHLNGYLYDCRIEDNCEAVNQQACIELVREGKIDPYVLAVNLL